MRLADVIDAYLTRQRSLGMRFDSAGQLLRRFSRAMGDRPIQEMQSWRTDLPSYVNHVASPDRQSVRLFWNHCPASRRQCCTLTSERLEWRRKCGFRAARSFWKPPAALFRGHRDNHFMAADRRVPCQHVLDRRWTMHCHPADWPIYLAGAHRRQRIVRAWEISRLARRNRKPPARRSEAQHVNRR